MTLNDLLFEDRQAALREAIGRAQKGKKNERLAMQKRYTTEELMREREASK